MPRSYGKSAISSEPTSETASQPDRSTNHGKTGESLASSSKKRMPSFVSGASPRMTSTSPSTQASRMKGRSFVEMRSERKSTFSPARAAPRRLFNSSSSASSLGTGCPPRINATWPGERRPKSAACMAKAHDRSWNSSLRSQTAAQDQNPIFAPVRPQHSKSPVKASKCPRHLIPCTSDAACTAVVFSCTVKVINVHVKRGTCTHLSACRENLLWMLSPSDESVSARSPLKSTTGRGLLASGVTVNITHIARVQSLERDSGGARQRSRSNSHAKMTGCPAAIQVSKPSAGMGLGSDSCASRMMS
mmetsp:Transcript_58526/g.155784  ORF Transcript_58526/g.155784 Transcript_58526/m.155784 type:complete len:304 (-) Transcript_58526:112-1023(-)